jgi:ZIP family zinc transporter
VESFFSSLSPISQALVASLFTWGVTALGAALVFFTTSVNRRLLELSRGS